MKNSSDFVREKVDGAHIFRRRDCPWDGLGRAIELHQLGLEAGGENVLKNDVKTGVTRVRLPGSADAVCVKEFKRRAWTAGLVRRFYGSKARRAWRAANGLPLRDVNTPRPLACVENRWAGLILKESFLISKFLEGASRLDVLLHDPVQGAALADDVKARRTLVTRMAETVSKMHTMAVHHHDLAPKNWLVRREGSDWELNLVDLEEVNLRHSPSMSERIRSIVQLYDRPEVLSMTDRLRFLKVYSRHHPEITARLHCARIREASRLRRARHLAIMGLPPEDDDAARGGRGR